MNYKFETLVEKVKFDVLREIAKATYAGTLDKDQVNIPQIVSPGPKSNYRCCIYMERAIVQERIKITRGEGFEDKNIIQVIPIACDQCPMGGYTVTDSCRGCIGHACLQACPKGAITIDNIHRAHIDKTKCINCGMCAKACPFGAIYNFRRPCQKACFTGAITMDENLAAKIDDKKCISCGACMQRCPFGAIADVSQMVQVIDTINTNKKAANPKPIVAIVAPAIASQFNGVVVNQVAQGIEQLGFDKVVEAALGADIVAWEEGNELTKKQFLTSSCCPAFVDYIYKFHPQLKDKVSHALSPMAQIAKVIKTKYPEAITVFVGPCTAKKMEARKQEVKKYVDYVLTFAELRAMFAAKDIDLDKLPGVELDQATGFGRGFASCGGLSSAVVEVLKELDEKDFKLLAQSCSGMKECIDAINQHKSGINKANFIEGMACEGGCVNGAGSITHNAIRSKAILGLHKAKAKQKTIKGSASRYWENK